MKIGKLYRCMYLDLWLGDLDMPNRQLPKNSIFTLLKVEPASPAVPASEKRIKLTIITEDRVDYLDNCYETWFEEVKS